MRAASVLLALMAVAVVTGCRKTERPAVAVTAVELHTAFAADERDARRRFDGRDLVIRGELAMAQPRFRGTTMKGEMIMPAKVYLRTEVDTLPTDIKYVEAEGSFEVPDSIGNMALDPRLVPGTVVRVSCPHARIRWTDPGLYLSDCSLAGRD